jgi:hypothetical protein
MAPDLLASPFLIAALALGALGAILIVAALVALFRLRPLSFALRTLAGLLLLSLGSMAGMVALGTQGYRALTREDVAARLFVQPSGAQRFLVTVRFADGRDAAFDVAGDEVYVDARMLKWKPVANLLGLHTAYELDRVAGRYRDIAQERAAPRTVHSLGQGRPVNLFRMRQRYEFLGALFDAEYGSASFVPVTRPAELELRVSTSGLLIREVGPPPQ